MSEPDSLENRRCSEMLVPKPSKAAKKGAKSVTSAAGGSDLHDGPSSHQMNGYDNHVTSQLENQLESENIVNHVQTITVNGYNDVGGHLNGDVSTVSGRSERETKDVRRKRRSQSGSSDGSPRSKSLQESDVGFMWTQTNGHHALPDPDPTPLSPDVFYSSTHEVERPTDDMNGYVNANSHMLAYLELNRESNRTASPENLNIVLPDNGVVPNGNENGEIEDDLQSDKIDEGIALTAELEFIPLATTTKLSTSSEDQGDFIETDISLQQLGFSSYASSRGSSCNDLPNLVQASDREQHIHNNNVMKDNDVSDKVRQLQHKCESCERNQQASCSGAFNLTPSGQHKDCYNHGSNIKSQSQASSSGGHHSNDPFSLQMDSRNAPESALDEHETRAMWRNISQPPPLQWNPSTTNRSSTSSFYSPDMDIEFMDLDFEPGLVNSDSQQEFQQSESGAMTTWPALENNHFGSSSNHGAERDKFSDNDENIDNCFCYGCDKISDKFSNHSSHFKSCSSAKANPLISCCRHRGHHHVKSDTNNADSESSNSVKQNVPKCKDCDEQRAHRDAFELPNNINDGNNALELLEGAVGFSSTNNSQSHSVPNNLDMVGSNREWNVLPESTGETPAHYNVSRQTSTSNFNQDENNFQDYFGAESNLNRPEGDSYPTQGKDYFTRPKNVCVQENEPLLHGANLCRLSCIGRQDVVGEDDNEADDEQEEEDEGTPPPIPNTRPPLNRRLELLEAHNQNLEQNFLLYAAPSSSLNSENQVLAGAVGGPDFRPGATNFGDDESPSRALHLLEYQFQSDEIDFNTRRQVPRPNWLPADDDSPLRALRFLEHQFSSQSTTSGEAARQMCGEDGCSDISPTVGGLHHMAAMDSLADMYVVNLLRKKPSSRRGGLLVTEESDDASMEKVMIWSEYEAYVLQVKQIGVSACGATAVINVLKAFDIYPDKTAVCKAVKTNLRAEMSSVPEYLLSRSVAGTTAHHLIEGIDELTNGEIYGRFFHFWPPRDIELKKWLAEWMKKGAVPVVTLNLQKGVPPEVQIPDAWHHQMVYGVGSKGIYLTNPLDVVSESAIYEQLTSDSVLLVRRSDIILRWTNSANLAILLNHSDTRWRTMNVAGQVVNAMRESNRPRIPGFRPQQTSHVLIPAFYKAGITLFVKKDSAVYNELLEAPDVPLKKNDTPKYTTTPAANEPKPTNLAPPPQPPVPAPSQTEEPSTSTNCANNPTTESQS